MTWHYAIVRRVHPVSNEPIYDIREVYLDGDDIIGWTGSEVNAFGTGLNEFHRSWNHIVSDVANRKILDISDEDQPRFISHKKALKLDRKLECGK